MPRIDQESGRHPDPQLLAARATGLLDAAKAAEVDAHLAGCVLCRLEVKRAARFQALEHDDEAAATADWERAEVRLDADFRATLAPALARRRRVPRWLVPAAAAAVLALLAVNLEESAWHPLGTPGVDTVRGLPAAAPVIRPLGPTGEVAAAPARFTWTADRAFDAFALEVFTAELGTVVRLDDLHAPHANLADSLVARFAPGTVYFWHVEGWDGLSAAEASPTVSFRIASADSSGS